MVTITTVLRAGGAVLLFSTGLVAILSLVSPSIAARFQVKERDVQDPAPTTCPGWCEDDAVVYGWYDMCFDTQCSRCGPCLVNVTEVPHTTTFLAKTRNSEVTQTANCDSYCVHMPAGGEYSWDDLCTWSTCSGCSQCAGHCPSYCAEYATGGYGFSWGVVCGWQTCEKCGQCGNYEAPQTTTTAVAAGTCKSFYCRETDDNSWDDLCFVGVNYCWGCAQCATAYADAGNCIENCEFHATKMWKYGWDEVCRWSSCRGCAQCGNSEALQTTTTTVDAGSDSEVTQTTTTVDAGSDSEVTQTTTTVDAGSNSEAPQTTTTKDAATTVDAGTVAVLLGFVLLAS